jgi:hypothetical protein
MCGWRVGDRQTSVAASPPNGHRERIRVRSIAFAGQRSMPLEESAEEALRRGHRDGCEAPATCPCRCDTTVGWRADTAATGAREDHRWLATRESGEVQSLREIARREGVDSSFVNRMVNLTNLALISW